jgi:hypothetical protein
MLRIWPPFSIRIFDFLAMPYWAAKTTIAGGRSHTISFFADSIMLEPTANASLTLLTIVPLAITHTNVLEFIKLCDTICFARQNEVKKVSLNRKNGLPRRYLR